MNKNISKKWVLECCKKLIKDKTDWKAFLMEIYLDIMKDIENNTQNLDNLGPNMEKSNSNEINDDEANYKFIGDFSVELIKNITKKVDMRIKYFENEFETIISDYLSQLREACLSLFNYLELDQLKEIHPSKLFDIRDLKGEKLEFVSENASSLTTEFQIQIKHLFSSFF